VVSFKLRPLYSRGNHTWYPLIRRLGGPQSRSGRCGEEKNFVPAENRTPARSESLYRLRLCTVLFIILLIRRLLNEHVSKSYSVVFNGRIEVSKTLEDMLNATVVKEFEALSRNSFEWTEENNGHRRLKNTLPVTGHGGPYECETSRLPRILDNRITGGGEIVSLKHRPTLPTKNIPGTRFC
jgi:hypothetical protein